MSTTTPRTSAKQLRVNGTDIHFLETGEGPPLLLLHGGFVSTDGLWDGHPATYNSHLPAFAERFRVIAPDARGYGRTRNSSGGSIAYADLADDVLGLSAALGLDRPLVCGFSEGGTVATVAAMRSPGAFRAVVNDAGFDMINPRSPAFSMGRKIFGGSPDATKAAPESFEAFATAQGGPMADLIRRMQLDHRDQGPGGWKAALAMAFDRMTVPADVTPEHLRKITAPTLVLVGDRDMLCPPEEAVATYRLPPRGELATVPGARHDLSRPIIETTIDFLQRHSG